MANSLSEVYGDPLPDNLPSLWQRFNTTVKEFPNSVALVATHQKANLFGIPSQPLDDEDYTRSPYLRWTFKNLKAGISRLTLGLEAHGVQKGMPIITFLQNSAEFILTNWAAREIGCVFVPINPRNLVNKAESVHMIQTVMHSYPGQQPVIVALNEDLATAIDSLSILQGAIKIVANEKGPSSEWIPFHYLMEAPKEDRNFLSHKTPHEPTDDIIFFTSGTTSLPKGCKWTHPLASAMMESRSVLEDSIRPGDKSCIVIPNNHALGYTSLAAALCYGATVVLPGASFVPHITLNVMHREKVTHISLVPTMVHALLGVKAIKGSRLEYLKSVMLGGAVLTPEVLRQCIEDLGANGAENAFGMTEGYVICTGNQRDPRKILKGDDISVGWVLKGTALKVCGPGEKTPLPRGSPGELHISGLSLNREGYIGKPSDEYYNDVKGRQWFVTGDQAIIDVDGRVYIVGRYKDMIIRGGENIAPASIESAAEKNPALASLNLQVVGAPDPIAGEVPVVVTQKDISADTAQVLHDTILKRMGTIYVPDEVISLRALDLNDYPRTMAGKVQKTKLAELVRKYRSDRDAAPPNILHSQLAADVKDIWARAVGLDVSRLSIDSPISDFADSITVMRVRDKIKRQTGKTLSLAEIDEAGTISEQIKILQNISVTEEKLQTKKKPRREGPPAIEDMAHLTEEPELFEPTKQVVLQAISPYGLDWTDVEDIMPVYDFANILAEKRIIDSWNFKMAVLPENTDAKQLRAALETMLMNNRIIGSFFVWDRDALESDIALHVTIRQKKKLFDQIIQDGGTLQTLEELKALPLKYPHPEHASFPGPMFRALIYYVEETQSFAFIFNVNHAVIDASYAQIFFEDFDRALGGGMTQLPEHVDYKIWADSYFSLRTSPEARAGVKWHLKRLKDLKKHQKALYPLVQKREAYNEAIQEGDDGIQHSFEAPDLPVLRKEHLNLTAIVILKAALALLNVHRTRHTHALFSNLEAARTTFPFIPKSMQNTGQYEATDVAGPTIESVINLIEISPEEKVLDFLQRMQNDQTNLTKYASAPTREIMAALGEAGDMIPAVTQEQIFNWVPGMGTTGTDPYSNFKVLNAVVRPQVGVALNIGMGGAASNTIFMHVRGDAFTNHQMKEIAVDLEKITKWLVKPANRNAAVGEFMSSLAVPN